MNIELPTPQKIRAAERISRDRIDSTKQIKTWLFIIATITALLYTGLTSYALIYRMTEHRGQILANIAAATGILLTDGMLLYWTLIAFRKADSSAQRITAGIMAAITVTAIAVFGIGEQMLADGFVAALQMRYIVTGFVVAQIVGIAVYELTSYDAKLSMTTYKTNMRTVQLLDTAKAEEADSFADVILAEAQKRATFAHLLANQVRQSQLAPPPNQDDPAINLIQPTPNGSKPSPKAPHVPKKKTRIM